MGKISFVLLAAFLAIMSSCSSGRGDEGPPGTPTDSFCTYIPKDSANKMIGSYLTSVGAAATVNDSNLCSLIIDVKSLSDYLATAGANRKAVKLKLMFAHTLDYINNGGQGQNCGYQTGKLTMILATYDSAGNYIYKNGTAVMDHLQPCPTFCPSSGTASGNLLE